jgi:hypothetical protein
MPGRSPLSACGIVRVGPPAMSFVHSPIFLRRHFCGSRDPASTKKSASGRTGGGVFFERKRRKKSHRMVRPKRVFQTAGMPNSDGWVGQSVSSNRRNADLGRMVRPKRDFIWQSSFFTNTAFLTAHQLGNIRLMPPDQDAAHDHRREQYPVVHIPNHAVA